MKLLLLDPLSKPLVDQIGSICADVEVLLLTDDEALGELLPHVEIVVGSLNREQFKSATRLRWIHSGGAGVDGTLYPELIDSDVLLTSAKGSVGEHLADHAMALMLALTRGIGKSLRSLDWDEKWPIRNASWELTDRTLGIIGLGGTGRALARRARAFDMRITAVDPEPVEVPADIEACWSMDRFHELLSQSDVVAICAPLTAATEGMFDRQAFSRMCNHALLINVTRGSIVDETALLNALNSGEIGGAGLDVTPREPLPKDHPLWTMEHVVITPHTAGASPLREQRNVDLICENLQLFLAGQPLRCVIDKAKGY
jgi:phosphoglycerate dehydrogenase-like enzyme